MPTRQRSLTKGNKRRREIGGTGYRNTEFDDVSRFKLSNRCYNYNLRLSVSFGIWKFSQRSLSSCGMIPDLFTEYRAIDIMHPVDDTLPCIPSIHFLPWHREFGGKYWSRSNAVGIEIWPIGTQFYTILYLLLSNHLLLRRSNRRKN